MNAATPSVPLMHVEKVVILDAIRAARPRMIFYGANTCWWTHDERHLSRTPAPTKAEIERLAETFRLNAGRPDASLEEFLPRAREAASHRLPCDPRGGVLFQTKDVEGFLRAAETNPSHYGRHGLDAFLAAHHLNCTLGATRRPWCAGEWAYYNDAIDRAIAAGVWA